MPWNVWNRATNTDTKHGDNLFEDIERARVHAAVVRHEWEMKDLNDKFAKKRKQQDEAVYINRVKAQTARNQEHKEKLAAEREQKEIADRIARDKREHERNARMIAAMERNALQVVENVRDVVSRNSDHSTNPSRSTSRMGSHPPSRPPSGENGNGKKL